MLVSSLLESSPRVSMLCRGTYIDIVSIMHHILRKNLVPSLYFRFQSQLVVRGNWLVGVALVISTHDTRNAGKMVSSEILCWGAIYNPASTSSSHLLYVRHGAVAIKKLGKP